jgi:uncharacterized protein YjaZ
MKIIYAETVQTAFHTLRIAELGSEWEDMAMSGQNNGLCGSAIPGTIHLYCGPHTRKVSLQILVTHRSPLAPDAVLKVTRAPQ